VRTGLSKLLGEIEEFQGLKRTAEFLRRSINSRIIHSNIRIFTKNTERIENRYLLRNTKKSKRKIARLLQEVFKGAFL